MSSARPRFALLGWPLTHTLSPALYDAAFRASGIEATYEVWPTSPEGLARSIERARNEGLTGLNVTVPHKERVGQHLDALDETARTIGAVNTVSKVEGRLIGHNTDAVGLRDALVEAGVTLAGTDAVIIGAGGAARAACAMLCAAGAASVGVLARRPAQGRAVALAFAPSPVHVTQGIRGATLLVHASPATADPEIAEAFVRSLELGSLARGATVVDLVYTPRETALLRAARELGQRPVEGLGMLLHQAAHALAHFGYADAVNLSAMRAALYASAQ